MPRILVTGGCGYIGSHTMVDLIQRGFDVVSLDNLVNSTEDSLSGVEKITGIQVENHQIDLADVDQINRSFSKLGHIDGIIHFAALKAVGESVRQPLRYYHNNINGLVNLLTKATEMGVNQFVFSSSCTVYGNAAELPVDESSPILEAQSPYGLTKQVGELILSDVVKNTSMKATSLRYFNPAGAHESALLGESPSTPPQNLVPIITETAIGVREKLVVYGHDYQTRDGSCIRDYIHVMDLARAHTLALDHLNDTASGEVSVFNLGTGTGTTVLEAIRAFELTTGANLSYDLGPRRDGDVPAIYSNNKKAESVLGWKPSRTIEDIMRTAWDWEKHRRK